MFGFHRAGELLNKPLVNPTQALAASVSTEELEKNNYTLIEHPLESSSVLWIGLKKEKRLLLAMLQFLHYGDIQILFYPGRDTRSLSPLLIYWANMEGMLLDLPKRKNIKPNHLQHKTKISFPSPPQAAIIY